jgi:hypothetical protein
MWDRSPEQGTTTGLRLDRSTESERDNGYAVR